MAGGRKNLILFYMNRPPHSLANGINSELDKLRIMLWAIMMKKKKKHKTGSKNQSLL